MYAAGAEHPTGFESVQHAFTWPQRYFKRVLDHYGKDWLCSRLQNWQWQFSTAFSGIGAAENVGGLATIENFHAA